MIRPFIHDDFLLSTAVARRLYHEVARPLAIIDFHNHLDAAGLARDDRFGNLTELWIASDPYKHRAMRIAGVPEGDITGPGDARTKFERWAATVPKTVGSPLYHWTALELKRYFDIDELLSPASADRIWERANEQLGAATHRPRALLERANVSVVCTSDRAGDDLSHHERLAQSEFSTRVLPSLRVEGLAGSRESLEAVLGRLDDFDRAGCRLADHSVDELRYEPASEEAGRFRQLAAEYVRRGWTLQLHIGAQRHTSSRLRQLAGPAGGYAGAGNATDIGALCLLLDDLEKAGALPRTILYPLNPADYAPLAILTGSFAQLQLGPAWWYNDHGLGIRQHLDALANYGLISTFIGFTTDSRSLLSMVRHEYFRRLLCEWIGGHVVAREFPEDWAMLESLVRAICHDNAADYLQLNKDNQR